MAVDFDIGIIAGITEREGDHIYNSAVFISNTGELLGKHRKINLVPDVEDMYTSGTSVKRVRYVMMVESASTYDADNRHGIDHDWRSMAKWAPR